MKKGAILFLVYISGFQFVLTCRAEPVTKPFPQHQAYTPGVILPDHISQNDRDAAVEDFYNRWKERYLKQGCGEGRYYVFANADSTFSDSATLTVSEAHGYGMIIAALMAGYDPQAKTVFDGLYNYYKDHPSDRNPALMAWLQHEDCRTPAGEEGTATDGDMDIAYALLLADAQWGSAGGIDYFKKALQVIDAIMNVEINPENSIIMFGSWVSSDNPRYYYGTRSSDFMMHHLKVYQEATGDVRWTQTIDATYTLTEDIQRKYTWGTGLLPDFIEKTDGAPKPAGSYYLEGTFDGCYYYNACRAPWRIGTDYLMSGDDRAFAAVNTITAWMRSRTRENPENIRAGYRLCGANIWGNAYTDLAFTAPLGVAAMMDEPHQSWLNDIWDSVVRTSLSEGDYYGNTLKLISMLVMSGNWWSP